MLRDCMWRRQLPSNSQKCHLGVCITANRVSTLRIRFPKWDKNYSKSCCSPKSPRQRGYQPDPGTRRIHSVSQILLYHEMSQHISYKRDYPSLKVKEGRVGVEAIEKQIEKQREERVIHMEPAGMHMWTHAGAYRWVWAEYKLSACSVSYNCNF